MATIAELTKENDTLKGQLQSANQLVQDKTQALEAAYSGKNTAESALATEQAAHAKTRATAEQVLAEVQTAHTKTRAERDAARDEVAGASKFIQELNEQLSAAQEAGKADPTKPRQVKHDGKVYQVVLPAFKLDKVTYQAADVKEGGALLAELVRRESGVLAEVTA